MVKGDEKKNKLVIFFRTKRLKTHLKAHCQGEAVDAGACPRAIPTPGSYIAVAKSENKH